ncbi:hypothetical protein [Streptomyces sp. NPDC018031]|uniref:hypothetical protein n=1 Tax=Streptomyces sp. NPDC018031 TaxID=3365033 RepID=UPI00379FC47A
MTQRVLSYCRLATARPGEWGHIHEWCSPSQGACACPCHAAPAPEEPPPAGGRRWISLGDVLDGRT